MLPSYARKCKRAATRSINSRGPWRRTSGSGRTTGKEDGVPKNLSRRITSRQDPKGSECRRGQPKGPSCHRGHPPRHKQICCGLARGRPTQTRSCYTSGRAWPREDSEPVIMEVEVQQELDQDSPFDMAKVSTTGMEDGPDRERVCFVRAMWNRVRKHPYQA